MSIKHGKKELIKMLENRKKKIKWFGFPTKNGKLDYESIKMVDYIIHRQSNYSHKYFIIELMKLSWRREKELRFGYYILGKKPSVAGKWRWGQSAPLIPPKDLKALINKAKKKNFI